MLNVEKARAKAVPLIKECEGLRLVVYVCPAGYNTVGFGHRTTARVGQMITLAEAESFLQSDVQSIVQRTTALHAWANTNQYAALLSFAFNLGVERTMQSTLVKLLAGGHVEAAADQFKRWNKITKNGVLVVERGLTIRREAERDLFLCDRDL